MVGVLLCEFLYLCPETKKSENSISGMVDAILSEVGTCTFVVHTLLVTPGYMWLECGPYCVCAMDDPPEHLILISLMLGILPSSLKVYSNRINYPGVLLHLQVSEVSSGNHKLKPEFHGDIQIEEWPHYNEAERQLVRRQVIPCHVTISCDYHVTCRKYGRPAPTPNLTNSQPPAPPPQTVVKVRVHSSPLPPPPTHTHILTPYFCFTQRELPEPEPEVTPKRPKLEPPQISTHKQHPLAIQLTKDASKVVDPPVKLEPSDQPSEVLPLKKLKKKKQKIKKKKRDKANPDSAVTSDPSSTTSELRDYKR